MSSEDLGMQIKNQKIRINELENENKILKTKIQSIQSHKNQLPTTSKTLKSLQLTVETDKKKLYSSYLEVYYENNYLKQEILKQKKFIRELLKFPPPEYTEIYETYLKQCKTIESLKKNLQSITDSQDFESSKDPLKSHLPKRSYFIQSELEIIEKFCASLLENSKLSSLDLEEIWYVMNPNNKNSITQSDFQKGCRALNISYPECEIFLVFQFFLKKGQTLRKKDFLSSLIHLLKPN
jgi:chromosome segregation ATPase